jgi:allantoinase
VLLPDLVVRSRRVVTAQGTRPGAIHIRHGRILGILAFDDVPPDCRLDDAADAAIMPGIVDTHVHIDDSALGDGSGFEIVTRAAAAGGVTTIVEMPGRHPAMTVAALEQKRSAAERTCFVDVGFWGAVVPGNARELAPLFKAGVLGFACGLRPTAFEECPPVSEADLQIVMPALTRIGATLLVDAEVSAPIEQALARQLTQRHWIERISGWSRASRRYSTYLETMPKAAENEAVALVIQLCHTHHTRLHVTHLSSSDTLAPLFHARAARLPITAETCPHYLAFVAEEIPDGATVFKCAPPIRERANREFLWAALAGGLVQLVVSDHCAAPAAMKHLRSGNFLADWSGIPGLQLSLPAMWTGARAREHALDHIAGWMCRGPAQLAGLSHKGTIEAGSDADLIVFDPDAEFVVDATSVQPQHFPTPYFGRRLRGVIQRTYLRGTPIFDREKKISIQPHGRLLVRG